MNPAQQLKQLFGASGGKISVAVAESLTAGKLQAAIASVAGASGYFLGGITAYTLSEKVRLLGVQRAAARRVNCVSAQVAEEMARGVTRLFSSRYGVATTGYAEPDRARGIADPCAWWAVAELARGKFRVVRSGFVVCAGAKRVEVQEIVAQVALAELVATIRVGK